ncbi:uncharacterized protein FSUBG_654 [Fusarium subglutinans]|uniref:Uncharacterized protein n=1 Tax=Gibberella subglutinans TaxID=42677 RepID=A0A8H5QGM2_GIBSU|nr:uncharacterized protein FSUBG_654 [Fusarium subglutinans]KAF5613446.1 hypothetical protein FSUBG_654 [Fusarium subglutinans]
MPSFNPSKLLCCCKIPKRRQKNSEYTANDVALQPIPVIAPPTEEEHQEPSEKNRQSIIGLPNTAWAIPVRNSSFESGSVIRQHVDDDDSDSDQDRAQPTKKSSTAFDTVRNKLIRTISHSNNGCHPSHASVGNSEEEVARRAELKRIMHQRIQDELKSDESDDQIESKPTNSIRCMASVVDVTLPNSGPRDAIEFGVSKSSSRNGHSTQLDSDQVDQDTHQDSRVSQRAENKPQKTFSQTSESINGADDWRQDDVHPRLSPSYPKRHVSASEDGDFTHSQKSFQLSNGAGRLDRILGPDSSFNSRHASSGDGHSALGVWLIAQGLRSRDNSTLFLDEEDELEPTEDTKLTDYNTSSPRRAEGDQVQEARETPANGKPNMPDEPASINIPNTVETYSQSNSKTKNDRYEIPSLSGELPWGPTVTALLNSFTDHTSSSDPSKSQPSPMRSQQNLYKLDPKDLDSMELSPFKWRSHTSSQDQEKGNDQNSKSLNIDVPRIKSQSYGNIHDVEFPLNAPQDTTSMAQSESASFLQREAELGSIRRRFSEALALKKTEKRVVTRFREEFSESSLPPTVHKSFRSKIQLAIPSHLRAKSDGIELRHKGGSSGSPKGQNRLLIPLERLGGHEREASDRSKGRSNLSIRPHMSRLPTEEYQKPGLEHRESATDLWQRAIRLEAERRHSGSIHLSTAKPSQRSQSSSRSLNEPGAARNSSRSISDTGREVSQLTPTTDELSSPGNSKWLIERWVATMRPKIGESVGDMRLTRLTEPPKSWSRFPSHNREERNKNATDRDRVHPRDFAVKHMTSEGQIRWATDAPHDEAKQRARTLPRSFSTKFGELVKSKMGRIIPSKACMEYPEMGIRPSESGYTELQALGREISNMKGEPHLHVPGRELSKPQSSRSLGDRVVALMHEAIGQRHSKHDDVAEAAEDPTVPLTPSVVRESIAATDVFVTPRSRFSNDTIDGETRAGTEAESGRVKDQKTQLTVLESIKGAPLGNS